MSEIFSPRVLALRDAVFARLKPNRVREDTYTGPEPDGKTPFLDVFEQFPEEPYAVCLARGIVRSWMVSPFTVEDTDILAGAPRPRRVLYEHFSWGIKYNEEMFGHPAYAPRESEIRARVEALKTRLFPKTIETIRGEGVRLFGSESVYDALNPSLWWVGGYQGHTVPDYPALLKEGIGGALQSVLQYREKYAEKRALYDALEILLRGLSAWIFEYAEAADARARAGGPDAGRFACIARNCRAVAEGAPRTFYQACQLMWFYALWDWADCVGRADQYLYPFYAANAEDGLPWAREEIAQALWLKGLEHGIHNVTLSGTNESGADVTNELTYLFLQTARALHETHPRVSIRVHEHTPDELLKLAVRMWSEGMSDPTIVGDRTVIKGLTDMGIPLEDARDYCMLGCQEIEIPGRSNFGCEDGLINLAKVFELAANDGRDRFTGAQIGLPTGRLADFESVEALWRAYAAQMKHITKMFAYLCNRGVEIRSANLAKLVKMPFTRDCVARGLNPDEGGAIYNPGVVETAGASAVADAFAAIDDVVFQKRLFSMETLARALDANFEGYEKERRLLLAAPKFGNDEALADGYARRVLSEFWDEIARYRSIRGGPFTGACSLLQSGISYGENTWAMPDGRAAGEPLGNSIGPRPGADKSGLTAMLTSVAGLPLSKGVGGTTLNVTIPARLMNTEEAREKIANLMKTYLAQGGQMAQITTASREDMLDARVHPERHGDLIVRVGGFSIRFVELCGETQEEILSRSPE